MPYEAGLAFREGIGCVTKWLFKFYVHNERPIQHKPVMYGAVEYQWLHKQIDKQVRLGVIWKLVRGVDPDPTFVSNIVLVWGG